MGKWAGKYCITFHESKDLIVKITPVVLVKIELDSVTKQEEMHNIVKGGPKSQLLYVTVLEGRRYLV